MGELILSINAESSSLKFGLYRHGDGALDELARGEACELAGSARLAVRASSGELLLEENWSGQGSPDHAGAVRRLLAWLKERRYAARLSAIGHRIVHGGGIYSEAARVTPSVEATLQSLVPLAPLQQPVGLSLLRSFSETFPDLPQIACFDTAFHTRMPNPARQLALPRDLEAAGLRRYGFHGISYAHAWKRLEKLDPELAPGRIVAAHLGAGASLCALDKGRCMDTTMGFSPLDGLVMATHPGAIDPAVILYLLKTRGLSVDAVEDIICNRSGLLGVAGESGDLRRLLQRSDQLAEDAVDLFVHRAVQGIGAMAATLRGLDGLVFTGGVGEQSAEVRARICRCLDWLGVELDADANVGDDERRIDARSSCVSVWIIPSDEETEIARQSAGLLWPRSRADGRRSARTFDVSGALPGEAPDQNLPVSDPAAPVEPHAEGETI